MAEKISLDAKKSANADTSSAPITLTGLRNRWGNSVDIEGSPGQTGVVISKNGNPIATYRHPNWVLKPNTLESGGIPSINQFGTWKWENATETESLENARDILKALKSGELPYNFHYASEVEGSAHDQSGELAEAVHPQHPELNNCTYEDSTDPVPSALLLASAVAGIVSRFYQTRPDLYLELASVPQTGNLERVKLNAHPYLQMAAPKVAALVTDIHPRARVVLDHLTDDSHPNAESLFDDYQLRIWPVAALHTHVGIPKSQHWQSHHSGCDGNLGINMLNSLYTVGHFITCLLDSSTTHFLGHNTNLGDVRHSLRRLLPTANGSKPYLSYQEELTPWKEQLIKGVIHSPSRYPWNDQHGIGRPRPELETVESTNAGAHPHIGVVAAMSAATRLQTVLGIETTAGIKPHYGLPDISISPNLMVEIESQFDLYRWRGQIHLGSSPVSLQDLALSTAQMYQDLGNRYPILGRDAQISSSYLIRASHGASPPDIASYFDPNSPYFASGVLTDIKSGTRKDELPDLTALESALSRGLAELVFQRPETILIDPNLD